MLLRLTTHLRIFKDAVNVRRPFIFQQNQNQKGADREQIKQGNYQSCCELQVQSFNNRPLISKSLSLADTVVLQGRNCHADILLAGLSVVLVGTDVLVHPTSFHSLALHYLIGARTSGAICLLGHI